MSTTAERARVASMVVVIPAADLLSAIWYSDGSGARGLHELSSTPDEYEICEVTLVGPDVHILLRRRTPPPVAAERAELDAAEAAFREAEKAGTVIQCGASVRGDAVHARIGSSRVAVCGEENIHIVDEPWRADSEYSCKRCIRALAPKPEAAL